MDLVQLVADPVNEFLYLAGNLLPNQATQESFSVDSEPAIWRPIARDGGSGGNESRSEAFQSKNGILFIGTGEGQGRVIGLPVTAGIIGSGEGGSRIVLCQRFHFPLLTMAVDASGAFFYINFSRTGLRGFSIAPDIPWWSCKVPRFSQLSRALLWRIHYAPMLYTPSRLSRLDPVSL